MKNKWLAMILVTFMTLGLVGCGNSAKVVEKIELGASCIEQGDYQGAIAAYEEAIELDQYAWGAYEGLLLAKAEIGTSEVELEGIVGNVLVELQNNYANNVVVEEELPEVLNLINVSIQVLPSNNIAGDIYETANKIFDEETWQSNFASKAEELAWQAVSKGDADTALKFTEMMGEESYSKDSIIQQANQIKEQQKAALEFVEKFVTAIETKDWETLKNMSLRADFEMALATLNQHNGYMFKDGERAGKIIRTTNMEDVWYYGKESGEGMLVASKETFKGTPIIFYFEGTWNDFRAQSGHQYLAVGDKVWIDRDVILINGEVAHDGSDDAKYYLASQDRYVSGGPSISDFDEYTLRSARVGISLSVIDDLNPQTLAAFVVWEKIDLEDGSAPYVVTVSGSSGNNNPAAALEQQYGTGAGTETEVGTGNGTSSLEANYDPETGTISIQGGFTFGD